MAAPPTVHSGRICTTELEMTEQKTTGHISASSQSSIAALKDVLADGRLTQRGGGLNFVDFIFRGIE